MLSLLSHPPSPCVGICRLEGDGCLGCGRLMTEIVEWPSATAARKATIRQLAAARMAQLPEPTKAPEHLP